MEETKLQGNFPLSLRSHPQVPCSGEVFSVLMKGHGHDTVCGIEGFLHAISMVNINVNIQHSLVIPRIRKESQCCIFSEPKPPSPTEQMGGEQGTQC